MNVTVKIIGGQEIPAGVVADAEGTVHCQLPAGASLEDALLLLNLPAEVLTLVDASSIARADRSNTVLSDGIEVVVFPAIKGG